MTIALLGPPRKKQLSSQSVKTMSLAKRRGFIRRENQQNSCLWSTSCLYKTGRLEDNLHSNSNTFERGWWYRREPHRPLALIQVGFRRFELRPLLTEAI